MQTIHLGRSALFIIRKKIDEEKKESANALKVIICGEGSLYKSYTLKISMEKEKSSTNIINWKEKAASKTADASVTQQRQTC